MNESNRWEEFNLIVDNLELKSMEKLLLITLFRFVNAQNGYASPSRVLIKKLTQISHDKTLDKHLNSLIEKGYLERISGNGIRSKYFIRVPSKNEVPRIIVAPIKNEVGVPSKNIGIPPSKSEVQKENKKKIKENIYSDLDNEDYVNKINEELEEDLFNRIKSNYGPGEIKKELASLKEKGLSKLDLLKELENNLRIKSMKTKKTKSNDVENIFNYWNSKGIIKHKKLTPVIEKAIYKALKIYSIEEIRQSIEIYSEILNSKFYFSYKWHISDFLSRKNGISTFMEDGSNRVNYEKWKKELNKNENTTRTAIRDRGVFNEGAKDIKIELPKREHRSYTDEELSELGII